MTRPLLRLTSADDLPAPRADDDSALVLEQAIDDLARLRTTYWLGDTGVRLHALASLISQAHQMLPAAISDARDQKLTWTDIASSSASHPEPQPGSDGDRHESLDTDHPHNAAFTAPLAARDEALQAREVPRKTSAKTLIELGHCV